MLVPAMISKITMAGAASALMASLCCAGPLLLAVLGILSVPVAGALADRLFYHYWWPFIVFGLTVTVGSAAYYYRAPRDCAFDERKRIIRVRKNAILASLAVFAAVYVVFDFVIVEFLGMRMGLWTLPHW